MTCIRGALLWAGVGVVGVGIGIGIPTFQSNGNRSGVSILSPQHLPAFEGQTGLSTAPTTRKATTEDTSGRELVDGPRGWVQNALKSHELSGPRSVGDLWVISDLWGQLEPCQCKKMNLGSMAQQVGVLRASAKEGPSPVRIYAGSTFGRSLGGSKQGDPAIVEWERRRADVLVDVLRRAAPDVIVPGDSDWNDSPVSVVGLCSAFPGVVLCSNAPDDAPPKVVGEVIVSRGSLLLRVRGIVIPTEAPNATNLNGTRFSDPVAALSKSNKSRSDMKSEMMDVIVLSCSSRSDPLCLQSVCDAILPDTVVVLADCGDRLGLFDPEKALRHRNVHVLRTLPRGQEWLVASLSTLPGASEWRTTAKLGALRRLQSAMQGPSATTAKSSPQVGVDEKKLCEDIATEETRLRGGNVISWTKVPITDNLPIDEGVQALLRDHAASVSRLLQDKGNQPHESKGPRAYRGWENCSTCHAAIAKGWQGTPHYSALQTLTGMKRGTDTSCLPCHVTGFLQEGGANGWDEIARLGGVQCEACHGAGMGHPLEKSKSFAKVAASKCVQCHDALNSPEFQFERYVGRVACSQFLRK